MQYSENKPVVDFIIIGAMKAGTTTLVDYLTQNPNLCFSKPKEPQYFSRHFEYWSELEYESLWERKDLLCGEASTCYSRWPHYKDVPLRIFEYNPSMKLIYIVREPAERAYSHYRHNRLVDGVDFSSFDMALQNSDEILSSSMYMSQLKQFLVYFPRNQIMVVDFQEMLDSNLNLVNKIEAFLGVNKSEKLTAEHSNRAGEVTVINNYRRKIDKLRAAPVLNVLINTIFSKRVRTKIRQKLQIRLQESKLIKRIAKKEAQSIDTMTEEQRATILKKLETDINELEVFWKKDLSIWKR